MKIGTITQVSGPVVDVEFEAGHLPKIKEALSVELNGQTRVMEVAQHMSERIVRCIMLAGSEGLARGMKVTAPGKTIEIPVGEQTLAHRRRRAAPGGNTPQEHLPGPALL